MIKYYLIDDSKKVPGVIHEYDPKKALVMNQKGYGVYWTVNSFNTPERKESNLKSLDYWYVDIDKGTKEEQKKLIEKFITPSLVIETKNGHHLYWKCEPINLNEYRADKIYRYKKQLKNLVHYYNGDMNATDTTRILRVPGFYHMKDPANPFLCRCLREDCTRAFTVNDMECAFPSPALIYKRPKEKGLEVPEGDNIFAKAGRLNCQEALEVLSQTPAVNCERITFRSTKKGHNIYVNGKSTSCWVDASGYIGSRDKGGPTICQWLYWYHSDWGKVANILKEYFPKLEE